VTAVPDADLSPGRARGVTPPQVVVHLLDSGRDLEVGHLHTGRIHSGHDVADQAVLARRIAPLQHDEKTLLGLGEETVLQSRHLSENLGELSFGRILLPTEGVVGRTLLEVGRLVARDLEATDQSFDHERNLVAALGLRTVSP